MCISIFVLNQAFGKESCRLSIFWQFWSVLALTKSCTLNSHETLRLHKKLCNLNVNRYILNVSSSKDKLFGSSVCADIVTREIKEALLTTQKIKKRIINVFLNYIFVCMYHGYVLKCNRLI